MSGTPFRSCFRSNCRKKLNLLLEKDASFSFNSELPKTPSSKFLVDSGNLSSLTGATPKCCLDLSNISIEELPSNLLHCQTSMKLYYCSKTPNQKILPACHQLFLSGYRDHNQHIRKCIPAQLLCSTPSALGSFSQKTDATGSSSSDKENENSFLHSGPYGFKKDQENLSSPLSRLDSKNCVEGEMNDLGSPITRILLYQDGEEGYAEEISLELMEVFLEEQEARIKTLLKV